MIRVGKTTYDLVEYQGVKNLTSVTGIIYSDMK